MKKQISVYKVLRDRTFAKLVPVDRVTFRKERTRSWRFDGTRDTGFNWLPLEVRPSSLSLPHPDIWEIVPGIFAMEHRAYYELCSSTEETQQGRMNFVHCEGRRLAVIDSTLVIDCLDQDHSVISPGVKNRIKKYSFDGHQLAVSLFKIPETRDSELFTLDGFDPPNDFKTLVEQYAFNGVKFKKLWTGESFMNTYCPIAGRSHVEFS